MGSCWPGRAVDALAALGALVTPGRVFSVRGFDSPRSHLPWNPGHGHEAGVMERWNARKHRFFVGVVL